MKRWLDKYEWIEIAGCGGSDVHTGEDLTDDEMAHAAAICGDCLVRPECIEHALRTSACSVVVAGIYLPDPMHKKELKKMYAELHSSLPEEREAQGDI